MKILIPVVIIIIGAVVFIGKALTDQLNRPVSDIEQVSPTPVSSMGLNPIVTEVPYCPSPTPSEGVTATINCGEE